MSMYDLPDLDDKPPVPPCPACGGTTFRWGKVVGHVPAWFTAEPEKPKRLFAAEPETRARLCTRCGNVQLFIEPD